MERQHLSIDALRQLVQDDDLEVNQKLKALKYIISIKEKASSLVSELISLIERNNYPEILSFAIEALGEIGSASEPAVAVIGTILDDYKQYDSYDYIQNYAANSLGKINSSQAVPYLLRALESPDSQGPCLAAIYALARLRSKAITAVPALQDLLKKVDYKDYYPAIDKALTEILKNQSHKT